MKHLAKILIQILERTIKKISYESVDKKSLSQAMFVPKYEGKKNSGSKGLIYVESGFWRRYYC